MISELPRERKRESLTAYLRYSRLAAIVHGLPQLINDVDIDVDYPIDCDLETLSTSELSFPLPGESTSVLEFVTLIHLSRIMSTTLSQLYTTTDRRSGEEKIPRLRRELQSWKHRFGYDSETRPAMGYGDVRTTKPPLLQLWFPLMENVTTLLINRPGLTFDATTTEFRECLDICVTTCSTIIILIQDHYHQASINSLIPPSNSLIFQCALMHIFYQCCMQDDHTSARVATKASEELVAKSIEMLSTNLAILGADSSESLHTAISNTLILLRRLSDAMLVGYDAAEDPGVESESPLLATALENQTFSEPSSLLDASSGHALESLNHLDGLDWIIDSSTTPFNTSPFEF